MSRILRAQNARHSGTPLMRALGAHKVMQARDVINVTRQALQDAERDGLRAVEPRALYAFLDELEKRLVNGAVHSPEIEQARMEQYKAQLSAWVSQQQHVNEWRLEGFRQVIALGQAALKSVILINGGAAVAILAFLGHLASATTSSLPIHPFGAPLYHFVLGVLGGAVASGTTYLSQLAYDGDAKWQHRLGAVLHVASVLLGIGAYVLFYLGAKGAYSGFIAGA